MLTFDFKQIKKTLNLNSYMSDYLKSRELFQSIVISVVPETVTDYLCSEVSDDLFKHGNYHNMFYMSKFTGEFNEK